MSEKPKRKLIVKPKENQPDSKNAKKSFHAKSHAANADKKTEARKPISISFKWAASQLKKKKKMKEETSDVSFSSEDSQNALNSKPSLILENISAKKKINELKSENTIKVLNDLKIRLMEISKSYETLKLKTQNIEQLLDDVSIAFLSLSSSMNDNIEFLK